jgi:hypothetical protein
MATQHNIILKMPTFRQTKNAIFVLQDCNREWRLQFEQEFGLNATDFYDFPFHPKVLDYASFLGYCRLADWQTQCFIERCGDQAIP